MCRVGVGMRPRERESTVWCWLLMLWRTVHAFLGWIGRSGRSHFIFYFSRNRRLSSLLFGCSGGKQFLTSLLPRLNLTWRLYKEKQKPVWDLKNITTSLVVDEITLHLNLVCNSWYIFRTLVKVIYDNAANVSVLEFEHKKKGDGRWDKIRVKIQNRNGSGDRTYLPTKTCNVKLPTYLPDNHVKCDVQ